MPLVWSAPHFLLVHFFPPPDRLHTKAFDLSATERAGDVGVGLAIRLGIVPPHLTVPDPLAVDDALLTHLLGI